MSNKTLTIFTTVLFSIIVQLSTANALVFNILEDVDSSFSGNYFHDEVGPIGGITDTYQFTSTGLTNLQFFVSVNHDQGSPGATTTFGINNLIMTWSVGDSMHTITSAAGVVDASSIPFFHSLVDEQVGILSVTGAFREQGGGYSLSAVSAVPLPPAVVAFLTAMAGVGFLIRRKKKTSAFSLLER